MEEKVEKVEEMEEMETKTKTETETDGEGKMSRTGVSQSPRGSPAPRPGLFARQQHACAERWPTVIPARGDCLASRV